MNAATFTRMFSAKLRAAEAELKGLGIVLDHYTKNNCDHVRYVLDAEYQGRELFFTRENIEEARWSEEEASEIVDRIKCRARAELLREN